MNKDNFNTREEASRWKELQTTALNSAWVEVIMVGFTEEVMLKLCLEG